MDGHSRINSESVALPMLRFLRTLFSEPDEALYAFVQNNRSELKTIGIEYAESLTLEQIQIEYTRLFLGPKDHRPPYKSVYTEGTFWGSAADEVNQFMKQHGLKVERGNSIPPDHAAILFEILEKILLSELPTRIELYQDFLKKHVMWIFDFLQDTIENSKLQFYKSSFAFTRVFLKEEFSAIS